MSTRRPVADGRPLVALVVVVALLSSALAGPAAGVTDEELPEAPAELREHYDEVLAEEAHLIEEHEALGARRATLREELAALDAELAESTGRLGDAEAGVADAEAGVAGAEDRAPAPQAHREAAERELERATDELNDRAVSSYINGGGGADLAMLLEEAHTNRSARLQSYSEAAVGSQNEAVDDFTSAEEATEEALAEAEEARADAEEARADAEARRDEAAELAAAVEEARADKAPATTEADELAFLQGVVLSDLRSRKAVVEARIYAFAVESNAISELVAAQQADQLAREDGPTRLVAPLERARVSSEFGMRTHPILGTSRLHAGMDFSAPGGTPILAAAPGTVVLAGPRGGYGNTVIVDHGHNLTTLYAHQSRTGVVPGDRVEGGQVIGYVGSTGMSTGPHLHFETRLRGEPTNPRHFYRG